MLPGARAPTRRGSPCSNRHEDVLQGGARAVVHVDVARGDRGHAEALRQLVEEAVAAPVAPREGRCSSTRRRSGPKAARSLRPTSAAWTCSPRSTRPASAPSRAQPDRQTSPSAYSRTASRETRGRPSCRPGPSRVWAWARVRPAQVAVSRAVLAQEREVSAVVEGELRPVMTRTPRGLRARAPAPWRPSWSVSARAEWPCSAAAAASSGWEAPSRNERRSGSGDRRRASNACSHAGRTLMRSGSSGHRQGGASQTE